MKGSLMNWGLKGATALCLSVAMVSPALADSPPFGPLPGPGALQGVLDGITVGGSSSVDVTTDALADSLDSRWMVGGSGGSVSTIIVELAAFANGNRFGIYDAANPGTTVELFTGVAGAGDQAILSIGLDGSVSVIHDVGGVVSGGDTGIDFAGNNFGFYLDSSAFAAGGFFRSDSALNTTDNGNDHMGAYQGVGDQIQLPGLAAGPWGPNEYILAWEDVRFNAGSDRDFTDFVVLVESVSPVPEPSTMMLLGSSLLGLAAWKRRKAS